MTKLGWGTQVLTPGGWMEVGSFGEGDLAVVDPETRELRFQHCAEDGHEEGGYVTNLYRNADLDHLLSGTMAMFEVTDGDVTPVETTIEDLADANWRKNRHFLAAPMGTVVGTREPGKTVEQLARELGFFEDGQHYLAFKSHDQFVKAAEILKDAEPIASPKTREYLLRIKGKSLNLDFQIASTLERAKAIAFFADDVLATEEVETGTKVITGLSPRHADLIQLALAITGIQTTIATLPHESQVIYQCYNRMNLFKRAERKLHITQLKGWSRQINTNGRFLYIRRSYRTLVV